VTEKASYPRSRRNAVDCLLELPRLADHGDGPIAVESQLGERRERETVEFGMARNSSPEPSDTCPPRLFRGAYVEDLKRFSLIEPLGELLRCQLGGGRAAEAYGVNLHEANAPVAGGRRVHRPAVR